MRKFLRYEISGMTFIIWFVLFGYNSPDYISDTIIKFGDKALITGLIALSIGAIIHQFSVSLKNNCICKIFNELGDFPKYYISKMKYDEQDKYILERISNLNSYYYVRFDNGILSPFLALLLRCFLKSYRKTFYVNPCVVLLSIIIAISLIHYLRRICEEIKYYQEILINKYPKEE